MTIPQLFLQSTVLLLTGHALLAQSMVSRHVVYAGDFDLVLPPYFHEARHAGVSCRGAGKSGQGRAD